MKISHKSCHVRDIKNKTAYLAGHQGFLLINCELKQVFQLSTET